MVIGSQEPQDPAYRATLLYFIHVTHEVMRDMCKNLVEVLARVRVNLNYFKGKSADKRAKWRAGSICSHLNVCQCDWLSLDYEINAVP